MLCFQTSKWKTRIFVPNDLSPFLKNTKISCVDWKLLIGQTTFYWTSNEYRFNFSNIEHTWTYSLIRGQTQISYFLLQTLNLISLLLSRFIKLLIKLTFTSIFWILNKLQHVHLLVIKLEHTILLGSNDQTTNICSLTRHYWKHLFEVL